MCGSVLFLSLVAAAGYLPASRLGTGTEIGRQRRWGGKGDGTLALL